MNPPLVDRSTARIDVRPPVPGPDMGRRRLVAAWFWTGAALTFLILIIGGITRLTQSGLSIVDWQPFIGVVPPIGEAQWQETFDRYRQFPEYQQLRPGMTLSEFKFIFFWEYLHRLAARLIGVVFLVPFALFKWRGYLDRRLTRRSLALFALGGLQGFMGWFMVTSGLYEQPHVSHYRLAIHLSIAFTIFACCVWFALDLQDRPALRMQQDARRRLTRLVAAVGVLLAVQIFWGALVAGLDAGYIFNTFPLMGGSLVPVSLLALEPALRNFVENPATVQWIHRVLGTALALSAVYALMRARRVAPDDSAVVHLSMVVVLLVTLQYLFGVVTLLLHVPVALGVLHQATAMVLFGTWLALLHRLRSGQATPLR